MHLVSAISVVHITCAIIRCCLRARACVAHVRYALCAPADVTEVLVLLILATTVAEE